MIATERVPIRGPHPLARRRIAGAFVLVLLALGSAAFWTVVPLGTLWALGQATDATTTHFLAGTLGVPLAMALSASVLAWLNGLYLRISGARGALEKEEEESGWRRRVVGPLELMLVASFAAAIVALSVWFFVYAENPLLW